MHRAGAREQGHWMLVVRSRASTLPPEGRRSMRSLGAVVVVTALSDPQVTETALQRDATKTLLKTEALDRLPQLLSWG